jgi:hypothetical protein
MSRPIGRPAADSQPETARDRTLARGLAAAGVTLLPMLEGASPTRLSGDLNLAVAGFASAAGTTDDGRLLASSLRRSLEAALPAPSPRPADPDIAIAGPAALAAALAAAIAAGARRPVRFRPELAEAHAGLGLAYLPPRPDARGARAAYLRARHEYRQAAVLTDDEKRRRTFTGFVAFIDRRLAVASP